MPIAIQIISSRKKRKKDEMDTSYLCVCHRQSFGCGTFTCSFNCLENGLELLFDVSLKTIIVNIFFERWKLNWKWWIWHKRRRERERELKKHHRQNAMQMERMCRKYCMLVLFFSFISAGIRLSHAFYFGWIPIPTIEWMTSKYLGIFHIYFNMESFFSFLTNKSIQF